MHGRGWGGGSGSKRGGENPDSGGGWDTDLVTKLSL